MFPVIKSSCLRREASKENQSCEPSVRSIPVLFSDDDHLYLLGGFEGGEDAGGTGPCSPPLWRFNLITQRWSKVAIDGAMDDFISPILRTGAGIGTTTDNTPLVLFYGGGGVREPFDYRGEIFHRDRIVLYKLSATTVSMAKSPTPDEETQRFALSRLDYTTVQRDTLGLVEIKSDTRLFTPNTLWHCIDENHFVLVQARSYGWPDSLGRTPLSTLHRPTGRYVAGDYDDEGCLFDVFELRRRRLTTVGEETTGTKTNDEPGWIWDQISKDSYLDEARASTKLRDWMIYFSRKNSLISLLHNNKIYLTTVDDKWAEQGTDYAVVFDLSSRLFSMREVLHDAEHEFPLETGLYFHKNPWAVCGNALYLVIRRAVEIEHVSGAVEIRGDHYREFQGELWQLKVEEHESSRAEEWLRWSRLPCSMSAYPQEATMCFTGEGALYVYHQIEQKDQREAEPPTPIMAEGRKRHGAPTSPILTARLERIWSTRPLSLRYFAMHALSSIYPHWSSDFHLSRPAAAVRAVMRKHT